MKRKICYLLLGFLIGYSIGATIQLKLFSERVSNLETFSDELNTDYAEALLYINNLECELRKADNSYE